jgi:hypothetical protein
VAATQQAKACRKSVEVRRARAQLRGEIRSGSVRLSELLEEPTLPSELHRMPLVDLLEFVPFLRPQTYEAFLEDASIKLTAAVQDPTYRKRRLLADFLREWEEKPGTARGARAKRWDKRAAGRYKQDVFLRARRIA